MSTILNRMKLRQRLYDETKLSEEAIEKVLPWIMENCTIGAEPAAQQRPVEQAAPPRPHHIWCNFAMSGDSRTCKQCIGLYEKYPPIQGDNSGVTLAKEHFPEARPIATSASSALSASPAAIEQARPTEPAPERTPPQEIEQIREQQCKSRCQPVWGYHTETCRQLKEYAARAVAVPEPAPTPSRETIAQQIVQHFSSFARPSKEATNLSAFDKVLLAVDEWAEASALGVQNEIAERG